MKTSIFATILHYYECKLSHYVSPTILYAFIWNLCQLSKIIPQSFASGQFNKVLSHTFSLYFYFLMMLTWIPDPLPHEKMMLYRKYFSPLQIYFFYIEGIKNLLDRISVIVNGDRNIYKREVVHLTCKQVSS